jgi:hypothetical protein
MRESSTEWVGRARRGRLPPSVACLALSWVAAVSCAKDERDVQLVQPGGGGGATPSGRTTGIGMLQPNLLEVLPPSVDFGAVTTGFPSRARVKVVNSGSAPLPAPRIEWSAETPAGYEIIQNQCTIEVAPGESCELRVQLVPSGAGLVEALLRVSSGEGPAVRVPFKGEGFPAGNLILAPVAGSFEDYGGVRVGGQREGTFSILNAGTAPSGALSLRLNRAEFTLLPPQPGECVPGITDLAASQLCNLRVGFAPGERGPLESTLTALTPGAGSVSLNLAGNGLIAGLLEPSASTVDFAGVVLGSSGVSSVRFENQGDEPLTLGGARLEPADVAEFSIQNSTCGAGTALVPGASCDVALEFRPTLLNEERAADLVVDVMGGEPLRVGVVGHGLEKGSLAIAASVPGERDFGDVLLGQTVTRVFQISNPGTQPSGVLSVATSGSFTLTSAPEAGDCVDGSTSLVNGDSCTLRVDFKPTQRQLENGALTINSALAGASSLELTGRGILPAKLVASPEVNFGRVLTNATAERSITLKNAGDQPLPPPSVQITSSAPAQAAAFSVANDCSVPLAFGEECIVTLTFDPSDAVPHTANLLLASEPGGSAGVLLLGEALTPGSLVLASATGSADFGDVSLGNTARRSFTLTNPGNVASGRLTITTDDNHFLVSPGDCNQGAPEGLVDGSSCTFSVSFTPNTSDAVLASISVQSTGAGRAGLQLSGRGRSPAVLAATGNRDLGRANIGRMTTAANQFTWTVSNNGDLPSGTLRVTRGAVAEFRIGTDNCSNAPIAGHGSCQMQISFVPAEPPGARTETIVVTDTATNRAVTLVLTAASVRVANPGQSCINAECASGVCTDGVCCDRACDRVCQQCSGAGLCVDQSSQEQCGNGAARCFGVDQCKLPAGQACGADTDCGTGLLCKACGGGGRQCTPANDCCGSCPGNTTCVNGSCGCNAQQIDCGGGLCIPRNTANVCCPSNPDCTNPNLSACTSDGRCVQCTSNAQCGPCSTCNVANNTCTPRPLGTSGGCTGAGQACNGQGACAVLECGITGSPGCQECTTCNTASFRCAAGNQGSACGGGSGQCDAGQCRPGLGAACAPGGPACLNNLVCSNTTGRCARRPGEACTSTTDCAAGSCTTFFRDKDGDGHGDPNDTTRACSGATPTGGFVASSDDCCDLGAPNTALARLVFPQQTAFQTQGQTACSGKLDARGGPIKPFDYNCDGDEEYVFKAGTDEVQGQCEDLEPGNCDGQRTWRSTPICGALNRAVTCTRFAAPPISLCRSLADIADIDVVSGSVMAASTPVGCR